MKIFIKIIVMVLFLVCIQEISLAQSIDTQAPVISCPFNITVNATPGVCGAVVNYSSPAATDNSSSNNLPTSISGYDFKGDYNGHTYFMSNTMATPETAHANAIALGGHLVTINSTAENAFVSAMSPNYMWIGYTDRDVEGTFRWITDEPVTYTNWAPGEPNNAGGNEDWAVINWGSAKWNDWYYTASAYYVVEFSGGSVPTTLLSGLGSGATFPIGISTETWQATDQAGNVSTCSFTVTVVDNIAPTVVAQNITVQLDANGNATITTAQINNGSTDNCGIASIVVSKTAFNCSNVGANTVTLTVTDVNGNVSTGTAVVTVQDITAPIVIAQDVVVQLDENGNGILTPAMVDNGSTDECGIASMALTRTDFSCTNIGENIPGVVTATMTVDNQFWIYLSTSPTDAGILLGSNGNWPEVTSYTANLIPGQTYYLHIKAEDVGGPEMFIGDFSVTGSFQFVNGQQTLTTNAANWTLSQTAFGINPETPRDLGVTNFSPIWGTTPGISSNARYIWKQDWNTSGSEIVYFTTPVLFTGVVNETILTVTDVNGNSSSQTVNVEVEDNIAPVVITQNITIQLDANGQASVTAVQINNGSTDACGIASLALDKTNFDCSNVGANTVTLTVTDVNGNVSTATAIVTVEDNVAPVVITQNVTIQLDANGQASVTAVQINNGSTDACGIASLALDKTTFDCSNVGANTVILTVTDVNGNVSTATAIVTVEDNVAPVVITQNVTIQLDANGQASVTAIQINNVSTDACGIASLALDKTNFDCSNVGMNTVTLTVTDVNGNVSTGTAVVTVEDHVAPSLVVPASITQLNDTGVCGAVINIGLATAADNCAIASIVNNAPAFFPVGTTTVTWTATDVNGNATSANQTVTVTNNNPVINMLTVSIPVLLGDAVVANATFTDNNVVVATWHWGDGSTSSGVIGTADISGDHVYATTGLYDVKLVIEDACGKTDEETFSYTVVFNPCAGHVTGGGWINLNPGSYPAKPTLISKATFEFALKYVGNSIDGHNSKIKFQIKETKFEFRSSVINWLMVNNDQAIFSGTGTINGSGNYTFVASVIDGDVVNLKQSDYFRIVIKDMAGNVVFDNQAGSIDAARAAQKIDQGSIQIHKGKCKEKDDDDHGDKDDDDDDKKDDGKKSASIITNDFNVTLYPNPVRSKINLKVQSMPEGSLTIEIFDMTGRAYMKNSKVDVLGGQVQVNVSNVGMVHGNYIMRVIDNESLKSVKVLFIKE